MCSWEEEGKLNEQEPAFLDRSAPPYTRFLPRFATEAVCVKSPLEGPASRGSTHTLDHSDTHYIHINNICRKLILTTLDYLHYLKALICWCETKTKKLTTRSSLLLKLVRGETRIHTYDSTQGEIIQSKNGALVCYKKIEESLKKYAE